MASILYRVSTNDGYILKTVERNRKTRAFKKPVGKPAGEIGEILHYYVRSNNTDPTKKGRVVEPVAGEYDEAVVAALNAESRETASRNGQQTDTVPEITPQTDRLTVANAVAQWLATFPGRLAQYEGKAENGLSPSSIAMYSKAVKDFADYCKRVGVVFMPKTDRTGEQASDEVNSDMLSAYETYLRTNLKTRHSQAGEAKDRQGTIVARFGRLEIFFSHFNLVLAEQSDERGRGVLKCGKMPRANRAKKLREAKARLSQPVVIYSDQEIKAMLSVATTDEADLIKFLLQTGVRDKEAAHAEWSDLDGMNLNLMDKPRFSFRLKDKENRTIPLNPKLIARLQAREARQEKEATKLGQDAPTLIFPNSLNNPDLALDTRVQKVVERAKAGGFDWNPKSDVTMHKFRKNYATLMHRHGCEVTTVAELLGHSDTKTTQLYIATDTNKAREVSKIAFAISGD
jgi:integrase